MSVRQRIMDLSLSKVVRELRRRQLFPKVQAEKDLDVIPVCALTAIVSGPVIRVVGTYSYKDGYLPWCDLLALISVLVDRAPRSILEIGTFNGYTTRLMALNLPDAAIHTLDLPENFDGEKTEAGLVKDDFHLISARRVGSEFRQDKTITSIQQHFGDTASYAFPNAEFCFIDGSHTYSYVRNDTEKALATGNVKTLVWHDCDRYHPGVTKWLVEMLGAGHPVRRIEGTNLAILDVPSTI